MVLLARNDLGDQVLCAFRRPINLSVSIPLLSSLSKAFDAVSPAPGGKAWLIWVWARRVKAYASCARIDHGCHVATA